MPTTRHPSGSRVILRPDDHDGSSASSPGVLVLAVVAVLLAVGGITLGPVEFVADGRRTVMALVMAAAEPLAEPFPGTVHRAQVEAVANALLFVPVGALAALVLRRSGTVLPVASGVTVSVLIELAQLALPGRVSDPVDVVANTAGAVVGVALTSVVRAASHRARRDGARRPRRGLYPALVAVPGLIVVAVGCSSAGSSALAGTSAPGAPAGGAVTVEDGYVADGEELSAFADVPAITGLDDALRTAVQDAARDATADRIDFHVSSGWRSAAYQQALFAAAVERYGSVEAAREWVLRPDESAHVTGDAVDVGPTDAMSWLAQHGADYGLCQTYGNEMWHFELAVERGGECPAPGTAPSAG
ncbi:VanZ family protein [Blastococcus haudaquaticus]|uniref:D-alanyl-D-alanine carboxypeptidase n=1 Tax=Blastococcus haudaquaticus TaxID=1938745 RepID=A0A286GUK5_9ACTN|nr:VanZ family protein [Blastococcus haudaquaticus]SOD98674.1 D-alanyl-D-alanine carboxypeptidase [Blastococcus haudaquaticus]